MSNNNPKPGTNGELILELRQQKGWTQKDLAKEAGLVESTIWLAEQGRYTSPKTRRKIAEKLGIDPSRLLVGSFRQEAA